MIDLDDEDAFLAGLGGAMEKQAAAGVHVGAAAEDTMPVFEGMSVVRKPMPPEEFPQPIEYPSRPLTKRLATVDLETDPFAHGRVPKPFAAGYAEDDGDYVDFWGEDCVLEYMEHIAKRRAALAKEGIELVVYAHNGGKFDFNFFLDFMDDDFRPFLIDRRLVKMMFVGVEHRDSFSIMPVALKKLRSREWAKKEIDIAKMEPLLREAHKPEILDYLRADCMTLLDMVRDYIARFGWALTMASVALPYLRSFHGFHELSDEQDAALRPYYKGGRVQCFKTGVIHASPGQRLCMVDRNSMYPSEMAQSVHPVGSRYRKSKDFTHDTDFALVEAENEGALGTGAGIAFDFTVKRGTFWATGHEIRAGLDTGTLRIKRVLEALTFDSKTRFDTFVDHFYGMRQVARANGDDAGVEFYKLVLNSAYGKLAMNTTGYKDYLVNPPGWPSPLYAERNAWDEDGKLTHCATGWRIDTEREGATIWSRPTYNAGQRFLNVAAAASITGAARANLWRAICSSVEPAYCDTDSIICERFTGETDDKKLGAWKVEAEGDAVCIGGKKMYAFLSRERPANYDAKKHDCVTLDGTDFYLLKKAHKGVQLTAAQIVQIARGETVEHVSDAPTFKLDGSVRFQRRRVRMTGAETGGQLEMFEDELGAMLQAA